MSIQSELLEIQKQNGGLLQVQAAESWARQHPDSDLHGRLEWDDSVCGHAWRCQQIRQLIAIHIVDEKGERQVVSLTIDRVQDGGGYRALSAVMAEPKLREVLLANALADLERVQHKYETVVELSKVWEEVKKVRRRHMPRKDVQQPGTAA